MLRKKEDEKMSLDYVLQTKKDAMRGLTMAEEELSQAKLDIAMYKMVIEECDAEIADQQAERRLKGFMRTRMTITLLILTAIVLISIMCCSCCTVKGVMNDSAWILRTTADNIQVQEK